MKVTCAPGVRLTKRQVVDSTLFRQWMQHNSDRPIVEVTIYATYWGGPIGIIQMGVKVKGLNYEEAVFLRGPTVDMLTVVTDDRRRFIVHVEQHRLPVGQIVRANPAGMVDKGESAADAALRELAEEVGAHIQWGRVRSLHELALGTPLPLLVSPGGSDERVTFYVVEGRLDPRRLDKLSEHIGGLAHEGERLKLRLTPFDGPNIGLALHQLCAGTNRPDLKAVTSLLLYGEYLRRSSRM
jgi:8-oxo-dGTP pyrophosphatase MutT (NUDIX family)